MLELLLLIGLALLIWFAFDALSCHELATRHARQACLQAGVQLLDDALVVERWRLQRNAAGNLAWFRRYRFEFASDGEQRYLGRVSLLGKQLTGLQMDAYRDLKSLN